MPFEQVSGCDSLAQRLTSLVWRGIDQFMRWPKVIIKEHPFILHFIDTVLDREIREILDTKYILKIQNGVEA